ncbi:MAG: hypothetical protein ACRDPS_05375 [Nocardioides sp.]
MPRRTAISGWAGSVFSGHPCAAAVLRSATTPPILVAMSTLPTIAGSFV